jgi:hypothetical protein
MYTFDDAAGDGSGNRRGGKKLYRLPARRVMPKSVARREKSRDARPASHFGNDASSWCAASNANRTASRA